MHSLTSRKKNRKGQGLVEYALILVLVAIVVIAALLILGPTIGNVFGKANNSLSGLDAAAAPIAIPATAIPPTATPVPVWTTCASENGFCSFSGTAPVRYGRSGSWVTQTHTNGVACNNSVFGDPAYGFLKSCQVFQ
jgi:Flp pilus assembly pilin Flp